MPNLKQYVLAVYVILFWSSLTLFVSSAAVDKLQSDMHSAAFPQYSCLLHPQQVDDEGFCDF